MNDLYGPDHLQRELGLTDSQRARIQIHRDVLADWSQRMNLIGPKELDLYWRRHALDSAQLLALAPGARRWIDLGAGAGFPGLILAALLAEEADAEITLVESIGKKAAFLRAASEAMGVPAKVLHGRAEEVIPRSARFDVVTARAFAPLSRMANHFKPLLDRGAEGLFLKGADLDAELDAAAAEGWTLDTETHPSLSDPRGRILRVRSAHRRQG
jgi:16S rRNA (guanine527-N7)-methyltransferase